MDGATWAVFIWFVGEDMMVVDRKESNIRNRKKGISDVESSLVQQVTRIECKLGSPRLL